MGAWKDLEEGKGGRKSIIIIPKKSNLHGN